MPGLYTALASRIVFPLHERFKGHRSVAVRRAMKRSRWWDPERLAGSRLEGLRVLLEHAYHPRNGS